MPKIEINRVAEILKKAELAPALLRRVVEEMNLLVQPDPADEPAPPAIRKQFVILVSDPEGHMSRTDFVGWILQIPESESPRTIIDRIDRSVAEYNTTRRSRLLPVKTVGEAIENVPAKHFKEAEVWVKTKTPVAVFHTDNLLSPF